VELLNQQDNTEPSFKGNLVEGVTTAAESYNRKIMDEADLVGVILPNIPGFLSKRNVIQSALYGNMQREEEIASPPIREVTTSIKAFRL
jgi:hypothetical protein